MITHGAPDSTTLDLAEDIQYLPYGPIRSLAYGNGLKKTLRYDKDYRLTQLRDGIQKKDYQYDQTSNIKSITDLYRYAKDSNRLIKVGATPQALTNQAKQVVWQADYRPFGKLSTSKAKVDQKLRFPGQIFAAESGLHYNHFRDYNPTTGRYVQSDPIGLDGGLNTYAYVDNNPINYTDPKGLAKKRLGQEYRPCDADDTALCQKQCGSRGIKKCDRLGYFKPVRFTQGVKVYDWRPSPLSCVCNDDSNESSCGSTCQFFVVVGLGLLCLTPIPGDEAAAAASSGLLIAQ